jgi:hypothetical protein
MDAAVSLKESANAVEPASRPALDVLRLLAKGIVLLLGAMATVAAVGTLIPEVNDYALANLKKHERLAADVPKKIVFVGGSNLAFGLDSAAIEKATNTRVVNMGMDGFFGLRYMLEEVKPSLKRSDTVVVSLEYDAFYKSVDGTPSELFMVVKANPRAFGYLTWNQRARMAQSVPYVAQQKVLRMLREGLDVVRRGSGEGGSRGAAQERVADSVGTLAGFNEQGDLTSHLGIKWTFERGAELNISQLPIDMEVVRMLQDFTKQMNAREISVFISYTPAAQSYYDRHKATLTELHAILTRAAPVVVPRPPADFVFREEWFFDTVFHLTAEGRPVRTQKVIDDLQQLQARTATP